MVCLRNIVITIPVLLLTISCLVIADEPDDSKDSIAVEAVQGDANSDLIAEGTKWHHFKKWGFGYPVVGYPYYSYYRPYGYNGPFYGRPFGYGGYGYPYGYPYGYGGLYGGYGYYGAGYGYGYGYFR